ncbi:MAG: sugar nucleotide-binding protein [bacterium]|nr:sugar nucleotide-binding protein [bacterium]
MDDEKPRILVLGNRGMAGHVIERYFKEKGYDVLGANRDNIDAREFTDLDNLLVRTWAEGYEPMIVINCVGILKPNSTDRFLNAQINSALPHVLAQMAKRIKKIKLIHLSTNCVFRDKGPHEPFSEPDALDVYGQSKAFGEVNDDHNLTIRMSIVGPELKEDGCNLFNWFVKKSPKEVTGFTNAYYNGVTTLQLARFIEKCITYDRTGLINYYTKKTENKYDFLCMLNELYGLGKTMKSKEQPGAHSALLSGPDYTEKTLKQQFEVMKEWYEKQ